MAKAICCIDRCLTKSNTIKVKDIIYYLFPTDDEWAAKWEQKIKEFDPSFRRTPNAVVCSLHFVKSSMHSVSRQLVDHAVPAHFPQSHAPKENDAKKIKLSDSQSLTSSNACCVRGCSTIFDAKSKVIGFKFPKSENRRKLWLYFIRLYNNQDLNWQEYHSICGLHFPSTDFLDSNRLGEIAKPTIFGAATERRRIEIKQCKSQICNSEAENNVTRKLSETSAPLSMRRLSLPYGKLPTLTPKPKQPTKIIRISEGNSTIKAMNTSQQSAVKNSNISSTIPSNLSTQKSISKLPVKHSPAPSAVRITKIDLPSNITTTIPPIKIKTISNPTNARKIFAISVKNQSEVSKTMPWMQTNSNTKTYSKPSITMNIQNGEHKTKLINEQNQKILLKDRQQNNLVQIDNNGSSIIDSVHNKSYGQINKIVEPNSTSNTSINGRLHYVIQDNETLSFPRRLLERITANKRKNEELTAEIIALKKKYFKAIKQIRLKNITSEIETIDIS